MLDFLAANPQNIVIVGDAFISCDTMEEAVRASGINVGKISRVYWGHSDRGEFSRRQLHIEREGPEAEPYADGLDELIADADVLLTHFSPVPCRLIGKASKLKVILTCRGGVEHIDVAAATERNIPVVNVIRNAVPVAEFTLGLMIALTRDIAASHCQLMAGKWEKNYFNSGFTTTLSNLTVGLAGLGNVGTELAVRLKALGVPVIAHDDYLSRERLERNGLGDMELTSTLNDLFRRADLVSLHLRLTPETEKMIDRSYFSLMKPTAYFINTARGGLVNQEDLLDVLRRHAIGGAALDVFDSEPLTEGTDLRNLDNVVITPHIAGATVDAIPRSPILLMQEVDQILRKDFSDRIVNYKEIQINNRRNVS